MSVVVVDDAPGNLILMRALLDGLGVKTIAGFSDPNEAMKALWQSRPNLIIVDYVMPHIDGISFIRSVRSIEHLQHTPIIMVTTADLRDVRMDALEAGATDFITRPIELIEFKVRVRNLLQLGEAQAKLNDTAAWLSREVRSKTATLEERERELILRLSRSVEFRDTETGAHVERMAAYAALVAKGLGLDDDYRRTLYLAAPLHDIGKIGVSDSILLKEGALTGEERRAMEKHVRYGEEILSSSTCELIQLAMEIAMHHHERWDGKGYPAGLEGERIPLSGRITAVADVFDALTSERPYKRAWPAEDARAYLVAERGKHFDPACVDAFLGHWEEVLAICFERARPAPILQKAV